MPFSGRSGGYSHQTQEERDDQDFHGFTHSAAVRAEKCERYDNTLTNALDVYSSLAEVLIAMKGKVAASALLSYEEALARVITYPRNRWSSFDIPGVVAWGAASKALSKIA